MIDEKYYGIEKENITSTDFWTNRLYNTAYEIVKDRQFPIVIPSYNRPENLFLKWVDSSFTDETWPIYIVVRKSQVESYEASKYVFGKDYIKIVGIEDSYIDDIGKVRKAIVEHFSDSNKCVFMFDDDITKFSYTAPYTRDSGAKISMSVDVKSPARVFAMWQLAMEKAIEIRDDLIVSCAMIAGFNWVDTFCDEEESLRYMSGPQTLAVCINLDAFKKFNINYRTLKGNGHDDIDLLIRALLKGATTAEFRWISYNSPGIGTDILDFDSVDARFTQQYNEMYAHFSDINFVKWKHAKHDNVGINWKKAIDYHNNNFENKVGEVENKEEEQSLFLFDIAPTTSTKRIYNLVKELNI